MTVIGKFKPTAGKVYRIFISFAAFFLPLLILIGVYSKIAFVALRQVRRICAASAGIEYGVQREHNVTFRRELRVTKMLGLVVGAFVLCWGPFFSIVVLYAVCSNCPDDYGWVNISKWLHYANSTLNPLVYMLFTRTFRSAFRRLIVRGLCCKTLPLGGTRFNLNIWKAGSVEPTETLKTYRETTNAHRRITKENIGEMTGYMEHTKSIEGTKFRQLSVITGT